MSDCRPCLPEPSPPPWLNCTEPPHEFYRPIFERPRSPASWEETMRAAYACAGLTLIGAVLPVASCVDDIASSLEDDAP